MDEDTGLINEEIATVFQYLFMNYVSVQSEEVKTKEQEVLKITVQP